jgi:hypothetical protein
MPNKIFNLLTGLLAVWSVPAFATVTVVSLTPTHRPPQRIGRSISWTATATDSATGPLTFQFNVTNPNGLTQLVKNFNVGTLNAGTWTSVPFIWVPTGIEGSYQIQVVIKDFTTGQTASKTTMFQIDPLVTGSTPVVEATANPLVALFSAPSCASGSLMRVVFHEQTGGAPESVTNWVGCHPPNTMTFEIAGMYPSKAYNMFAQTKTGTKTTSGPTLAFTAGALPTNIAFPTFTVQSTAKDTTYPIVLHTFITFGTSTVYPDTATDLAGNILWYYSANDVSNSDIITRPLPGGDNITIQDDYAWDPTVSSQQFLRQVDLAGNIVRETNMGVIQQELLAKGAVDGGPCSAVHSPPPIGAACTGAFHHDAIQTLPNGWTAALIDIERIFPPGTQGDPSGLPVDIIGDMIIVMDTDWRVQWYWDAFDPAGGGNGYPLLPVSSTAVLAETCGSNTAGCPPVFLLGSTIAPLAHDWLHANSLYYWPAPQDGNSTGGDIVWSSRHQDWIFRIDYRDGAGTKRLLWRMGPTHTATGLTGNFTFTNTYGDPWPWFSHQHDVGIQNAGTEPITLLDNGDTRISNPPLGLGAGCQPLDCDSRGMAVNFTQPVGNCVTSCTPGTVTPVVSLDLGGYSTAMGSADLLGNGNYFFENAIVVDLLAGATYGYSLEFGPTPPAPQVGPADVLLNLSAPQHYRGWQLPSLYDPPTT